MKADRVSGFFWLAVGLIAIYGSVRLGIGTLQEPASGLVPFLAGCFVSLMAIIVLLRSFLRGPDLQVKLSGLWEDISWWRPVVIGFLLLVYILAFEKIGFLSTSSLVLFLMFKCVETLSWSKSALVSVLTSAFSYLLLRVLLKTTLPKGIFGF